MPNIPASFNLLHRKVLVRQVPGLRTLSDTIGQAHQERALILIDSALLSGEYPTAEAEAVFWHEVWHQIMGVLGEDDLRNNEKIADAFGGAMAQIMATADWKGKIPCAGRLKNNRD